jgi:hypothetical protein
MIRTFRVSPVLLLIGNNPDQLGPMSKSTSGIADPSTQNSATDIYNEESAATAIIISSMLTRSFWV